MMFTVASCRMAKTDKDCENTNIEHKVIKKGLQNHTRMPPQSRMMWIEQCKILNKVLN